VTAVKTTAPDKEVDAEENKSAEPTKAVTNEPVLTDFTVPFSNSKTSTVEAQNVRIKTVDTLSAPVQTPNAKSGKPVVMPKSYFFLAAELLKNKGVSVVYSRILKNGHFGIGIGVEFIDISTKQLGGIMPSLDVRYYIHRGKSTFMPIVQVGYNRLNVTYTDTNNNKYQQKGGRSFSLGLGYHYETGRKGSGPYAAIRYRNMQYHYNEPAVPTLTGSETKISLGWKF
jgi:hypothetical protein